MAKDFAELDRAYDEAGVQVTELGQKDVLVNKFVKAWENQTARRAAKGGGAMTMALTLAACGGGSGGGAGTSAPTTPVSDLTVGIDNISFAGILNAVREYTPGGNDLVNTLQSGDTIQGTGDADVMNVVLGNPNDSADSIITPTVTGVETVNIASVADGRLEVNMVNATGVENLTLTSANANLLASGLQDTSVALSAVNVQNADVDLGFAYTAAAVVGDADAVTVTVNGFNGDEIGVGFSPVAGTFERVETVNVVGTGASSTIQTLASNDAETITVTGAVTIDAVTSTVLTTLDTSAATGDTAINIGGNLGNAGFTFIGGDSDETLIANTGFVGTASLDAGLGTDTLSIRSAVGGTVGALNAAGNPVAAGFEVLDLRALDNAAFAVDMDVLPGVTSINMDGRGSVSTAFTLQDLSVAQAAGLTLDLSNDARTDGFVNVDIKTNTTADAVVLNVAFAGEGPQVAGLFDTLGNIESATVNVSGSAIGVDHALVVAAGTDSVTVTGGLAGSGLLMVGGTYDMETVDLSGVTSDVTIEIAGGAQALTTGTGDDEVNVGGTLARTDTIDLGEGENTLIINNASAATVDSYTVPAQVAQMVAAISNVDILQVSDLLTNDIDVDRYGSVQNVVLAAGATVATISSLASSGSVVTLEGDATDLTLSIDNATLAGRNSDELTVALDQAGGTIAALTLPGVDTLNISSEGGANSLNLTATSLDTLVVTGDSDLVITTFLVDTIQTVDASAMTTGSIDVEIATGGTTGVTMTGGASGDVLIGGDANDIINGGAGNDAIQGGRGNDQIMGGLGADGISGGDGADMIDLSEAVASADIVGYFTVTEGSAAGVAGGRLTGFDQITSFGSTDDIDVTALYSGADGGLTIVAQNAAVNNANDLTDAEFNVVNDLVAFFNDGGADLAGLGAETDVVAINFGDFAAIYAISDAAGVGNGLVEAGEITLLGTVDDILVAADFV